MHCISSGQWLCVYSLHHLCVEYPIFRVFILCSVIASKTHCAHLCVDCRQQDEHMSILSLKICLFLQLPDCEINLRKVIPVYLNNYSDVVNIKRLIQMTSFFLFILKMVCEAINADKMKSDHFNLNFVVDTLNIYQ